MKLEPHIFRAYDVRGLYETDFNAAGFGVLALAVVDWFHKTFKKAPKVLVTGDGRTHTEEILKFVLKNAEINAEHVVFGGIVPTPVNLLTLHEGKFDLALQITASHNAKEYNGMKISVQTGSVAGEKLQEIWYIANERIQNGFNVEKLYVLPEKDDIFGGYTQKIVEKHPYLPLKELKIVVDAGNGMGGLYPPVLQKVGADLVELFCEIDGTFPNHQPDPEEDANMQDLLKEVAANNADFGVAYDGDGDRLGLVVNEKGTIWHLNADKILYCLAADMRTRVADAKVVLDVMCSAELANKIQTNLGYDVVWSKTGHSHIEHTMTEHKALLGGEQSGHMMFSENFYGHDDACVATIRAICALQNTAILQDVTVNWPELQEFSEKFVVDEKKKFGIVKNVQEALKHHENAVLKDGVRIDWPDGSWGILRASNTSPKISVRVQASDQKTLEMRTKVFLEAFKQAESL